MSCHYYVKMGPRVFVAALKTTDHAFSIPQSWKTKQQQLSQLPQQQLSQLPQQLSQQQQLALRRRQLKHQKLIAIARANGMTEQELIAKLQRQQQQRARLLQAKLQSMTPQQRQQFIVQQQQRRQQMMQRRQAQQVQQFAAKNNAIQAAANGLLMDLQPLSQQSSPAASVGSIPGLAMQSPVANNGQNSNVQSPASSLMQQSPINSPLNSPMNANISMQQQQQQLQHQQSASPQGPMAGQFSASQLFENMGL